MSSAAYGAEWGTRHNYHLKLASPSQDRIPHIAVTMQLKGLGKQQREKTLRAGRTQSSFQQHKQECFQRFLSMSPFWHARTPFWSRYQWSHEVSRQLVCWGQLQIYSGNEDAYPKLTTMNPQLFQFNKSNYSNCALCISSLTWLQITQKCVLLPVSMWHIFLCSLTHT